MRRRAGRVVSTSASSIGLMSSSLRQVFPRKKTKKKKTGRGYEIRKSQLRELQGLTKESFPYQPHHHRWRWAINEIANIDERNWRSMLDLFQEVKNQGFSKRSFNSSEK
jgi:hypothetical protein